MAVTYVDKHPLGWVLNCSLKMYGFSINHINAWHNRPAWSWHIKHGAQWESDGTTGTRGLTATVRGKSAYSPSHIVTVIESLKSSIQGGVALPVQDHIGSLTYSCRSASPHGIIQWQRQGQKAYLIRVRLVGIDYLCRTFPLSSMTLMDNATVQTNAHKMVAPVPS